MIYINGKSAEDFELFVEPFSLMSAASQQHEFTYIPGVDAPIVEKKETYDMVEVTINADLLKKSKLQSVKSWLKGKAILVDDSLGTYYRIGECLNGINVEPFGDAADEIVHISATFTCEPFLYSVKKHTYDFTDASFWNGTSMLYQYFTQLGDYYGLPIITINTSSVFMPNAQCQIWINGNKFAVNNAFNYGTFVVDVGKRIIYSVNNVTGEKKLIESEIASGTYSDLRLISGERNTISVQFYNNAGEFVKNMPYNVNLDCNPRWI